MNRPQTPGRVEALRAVMRQGIDRSTADMLHLAGFNRPTMRAPAAPLMAGITFASGIDQLSQKERAALPF